MIKIYSLLLTLAIAFIADAQPVIRLQTGQFTNDRPAETPSSHPDLFADAVFQNRYYLWLQFNALPREEVKAQLASTGVELLAYLPHKSFIASFPLGYDFSSLRTTFDVYGVMKPVTYAKIDTRLTDASAIPWAVEHDTMRLVYVSYMPGFAASSFADYLSQTGAIFYLAEQQDQAGAITLKASLNQIQAIATHPLVQFIEPIGAPPVLEDQQGITNHRNNTINTSDNFVTGRKLDGTGLVIAIGDDGSIDNHIDFKGRIQVNATNTSTSADHGDHCAGIILGAPNLDPTTRGQAPGAMLRSYDGYADFSQFPTIYNTHQVRITSHSLGQTCNSGYNSNARTSDQQLRTYPSLMHVHSAGNSGNETCGGLSGWKTITGGYKAGKNVIAVANLSKSDLISSSSSKGPLPDGRLKPDIAAVGSSVNSTQPDNNYALNSGTSMSCPAVAGNLAVLYQAFRNQSGGADPNSGLMKAILLNTADEVGNEGPDFTYGWGRVNIRKAVECLEANRFTSGTVAQGNMNTHEFTIPANVVAAKIMVYWVDPEATAGAAVSLVNDLDALVTGPTATNYLPWLLDPGPTPTNSSCAAPAVKGTDVLNNVEQVQIDNPLPGTYTLKVTGSSVPSGPQTYYVVFEYLHNQVVVTHPFGGESFVPGETQRIRWDAPDSWGSFSVAYSTNEGATWTNISTTVGGNLRYHDWTVPGTVTSKARIRVTSGALSDISDTNFVILSRPTGITFSNVCAGTVKVSWSAVSNATGYDVFKLGDKYMELVASTSATNVNISGVGSGLNWYAVRAKLGPQAAGRRSNAVSYTNTSSATCPLPVSLVSFTAAKRGTDADIRWSTAQEIRIVKYVVERSATPSFDDAKEIGEVLAKNGVQQEYAITDKTTNGHGTYYYRLKTIETDKITYSRIISLKWDDRMGGISVYPNPASSRLFINANESYGDIQVELFSMSGARIHSQKVTLAGGANVSVDISHLPNGHYTLVLKEATGSMISSQRITVVN